MKLLFDENLGYQLVGLLACASRGSQHVDSVSLHSRADVEIWNLARDNGLYNCHHGRFQPASFLSGAPPKVVWLSIGDAGEPADSASLGR